MLMNPLQKTKNYHYSGFIAPDTVTIIYPSICLEFVSRGFNTIPIKNYIIMAAAS